MEEVLTNDNFILFCAKNYDNRSCHSTEEFLEDLKRIKYIKKLITRYIQDGDLKERLILNHIIVLNNVFGPQNLSRILALKMLDQFSYIKPFLVMLSILPSHIINVGEFGKIINTDSIPMDEMIVKNLRRLRQER